MPTAFFPQFWRTVWRISGEGRQLWVVTALASHVPEDCFAQVWRDVSQIGDAWRRGRLWEKMAPRIPEDCFAQVWNTLSIAEDAWLREKLLVLLAPCVPDTFFAQCWNAVKAIDNVMRRAQAIHALIPRFPQGKLAKALDAALAISYRGGCVEVLEAPIPRLSTEQCAALLQTQLPSSSDVSRWSEDTLIEALNTMMHRQREWWKRIILPLVPRLPEERVRDVLPAFLKVAALWKKAELSEDEYTQIVTSLAANVPAEQAEIMLDAIWSIESGEASEQALLAYLATLAPASWTCALDLATAKTRATGDVRYLLGVLVAASSLSEQPALLYPALREILHILEQRPRPQALSDLTKLAPVVRALGGEEAITATCCSILEIGSWWP